MNPQDRNSSAHPKKLKIIAFFGSTVSNASLNETFSLEPSRRTSDRSLQAVYFHCSLKNNYDSYLTLTQLLLLMLIMFDTSNQHISKKIS